MFRLTNLARVASFAGRQVAQKQTRFMSTATIQNTAINSKVLYGMAFATAGLAAGTTAYYSKPTFAKGSIAGEDGGVTERTFMAIKPDGVQRGLVADIIGRMEAKGYKLVGLKLVQPTEGFAAKHYDDLKARPFFKNLCKFMSSGPVVAMVWEGPGVIKMSRTMIGATDPLKSPTGSIRGDLATSIGRNIIHGSDSYATAVDEIGLWFKESELVLWNRTNETWISSNN